MKKVNSFIAVVLIASFTLTACGNSSSSIEKDAKKYADLACKAQKLGTKAGQGDMSVMTEYTELSKEIATFSSDMQKKYKESGADEYQKFLSAYTKAAAECK